MPNSYSDLAARIRVPLGLLLGVVYLVFAQPAPARLLGGSAVAFAGLLLRAYGAGHLAKNQALATSGPYSYTRHPLYLGSILAGIGYCIAGGRCWFFVLLVLFLGAVYWPVIRKEEAHLRKLFPEEYDNYARSVPFLVPRRKAWAPAERRRFRWSLYWQNREYQALLAYVAIVLILALKLLV